MCTMPAELEPGSAGLFWAAVAEADKFFMHDGPVHHTLRRLTAVLERERIPYAIVGALALNLHGFRRVTVDVDVLLSRAGLAALKRAALGHGYVEKFPGSKGLRDTESNVVIDVLIAGDYPGDGKPKPVSFPDPEGAIVTDGVRVLRLPQILEMKLASGLSAPHRLKDLADVLEVVRALALPRETGQQVDPSVRDKFDELWLAAQAVDP
jgi:hypothetical protein